MSLIARMRAAAPSIIELWFGVPSLTPRLAIAKEQLSTWYMKSADFDARLRDRYQDDLQAAIKASDSDIDALTDQCDVPTVCAVVILLDQFARNIYRDTAAAFSADAVALRICQRCIANGVDVKMSKEMHPFATSFLYHPLMHSEDAEMQRLCVQMFQKLVDSMEKDDPSLDGITKNLHFAVKHRDIIDEYGRFPHRNRLLGRESSAKEQEALDKGLGF